MRETNCLDQQHLEDELRRARRELESLTHSVSHDLRAPLRAIDCFSAFLQKEAGPALDENCRDYLRHIREAAQQLDEMLNGLLELSRIASQEISLESVDLRALAASLQAGLKGCDVELVIGNLPVVSCDPALIRRVFESLLSNAVKFTRGRERARIEVGSTEQDGRVAVYVRDNGAGFDMRHAARLFNVFQSLHSRQEFEGIGLGLAIVRRIVERHGGRAWAEGEPGRGATFYFTLWENAPCA